MAKFTGHHATLSINGDEVGQIQSISQLLGGEVSVVDVTTLDSTVRESIPGIGSWGDCSFEVLYDPTTHADFHGYVESPEIVTATITVNTLGNSFEIEFDGFLTQFTVTAAEVESAVIASVTFKIKAAVDAGSGGA